MSEIRRPPVLGIRHQRVEVLFQRREIEFLELICVVEASAHGIGQGGILVKHFEVQLIRPPIAVGPDTRTCVTGLTRLPVTERALTRAFLIRCIHDILQSYAVVFLELSRGEPL